MANFELKTQDFFLKLPLNPQDSNSPWEITQISGGPH